MINFIAITPHPPIIIPEVGKEETKKCSKTIQAMEKLAQKISDAEPEIIIVISPHAMVHPDRFAVYGSPKFYGDFGQFGASGISFSLNNNVELASDIVVNSKNEGVETLLFGNPDSDFMELDHGEMVPLYYLTKKLKSNIEIIPIAYSFLDRSSHIKFGQIIQKTCSSARWKDIKIALIASGDLSHRLDYGTTGGYGKIGQEFDQSICKNLMENNILNIKEMDEDFIEKAGECGYRSILVALGALEGLKYQPDVLSYEGPFGVGYLVANFELND